MLVAKHIGFDRNLARIIGTMLYDSRDDVDWLIDFEGDERPNARVRLDH